MTGRIGWALAALLGACGRPEASAGEHGEAERGHEEGGHEQGEGEHGDEHEHGGIPTEVRLSEQVIADAKIATEPVRRETVAPTVTATGEIAADPARTAQVAARVAGIVEAVEFREGDLVAEGQVLAKIRAPSLGGLRADLAALQARAVSAKSNLTRLETLAQRNMASQQELAAARAEAAALDAESRAAGQRLKALGLGSRGGTSDFILRAPAAGFITRRGIVDGQAVVAEDNVATIVNLDRAWFMARVFEHMLVDVKVGAPAEVELNGYPGQFFVGKIDFLSPQVDPDARTIVARIVVDNRDALLRIGLFGVANIAVDRGEDGEPRLVVPRTAVIDVADKKVVFVKRESGEFEVHEVVLGVSAPGKIEVVRGLEEGEQVVVHGAWTLKSVLLKETFGEDHH
ncbi:efflux RND transporter periplasmic adaptor subunit [Nannocystis radixulma]|uniref:Efflux RND transporter periplasmic adaptor subunit n=1 Tax=Nannocystis radixulma TaxID=2995305 RepID=A0ABT5BP16_9BACT|nr:efflux RND transporter periplasmic adaptor subunit [Nannocystis radixulma]MDC0675438.1 efflux RND transporter periplasmic adaptor subunit [Nannocystis radixulma]